MPWPMVIEFKSHHDIGSECLEEYLSLRREGFLCDLELRCNGNCQTLKVHKCLLCAVSRKIDSDLDLAWRENDKRLEYHIDCGDVVLESLVHWIYTGVLKLADQQAAFDMLVAVQQLEIDGLSEICLNAIKDNLDDGNVFQCLLFDHDQIQAASRQYACWNFKRLIDNHRIDVLNLPFEQFALILSDDRLNVRQEDEVWKAITSWTGHDLDKRKSQLAKLCESVRIGLVKEQTFEEMKTRLLPEWREAVPPHFLEQFSALPRRDELFLPRLPAELVILIITGHLSREDYFNASTQLHAYDVRTDSWQCFGPQFEFQVLDCAPLPVNEAKLVLLTSKPNRTMPVAYEVLTLNLNTFQTETLSTLNVSTPFFNCHPHLMLLNNQPSVCQSNHYIETYSEAKNSWHLQEVDLDPPTRQDIFLREAAFASDGENLFCVGGQLDRGTCDEIRKFNHAKNVYEVVGQMHESRCFAGVCHGNNKLFVAGGVTGGEFVLSAISSVEEYNFEDKTVGHLPPLELTSMFFPSMISIDGGILVIENAHPFSSLGRRHKRRCQYLPENSPQWGWRRALRLNQLCSAHSLAKVETKYFRDVNQLLSPTRIEFMKEIAESNIRQENNEGVYDLSSLFAGD